MRERKVVEQVDATDVFLKHEKLLHKKALVKANLILLLPQVFIRASQALTAATLAFLVSIKLFGNRN